MTDARDVIARWFAVERGEWITLDAAIPNKISDSLVAALAAAGLSITTTRETSTSGHSCDNCEGIDIGTCVFNPDRAADDAIERREASITATPDTWEWGVQFDDGEIALVVSEESSRHLAAHHVKVHVPVRRRPAGPWEVAP